MKTLIKKLFPEGFSDSFLSSKYPRVLKYHRLVSSLFFLSCMLFYLIRSGLVILRYLTLQGFLLTTSYFTLSFICYFTEKLKPICAVLFELIWSVNFIVTLAYWSYLSDYTYTTSEVMGSIIPHSAPFFMTVIDFVLNEVQFFRRHYLIALTYLILYAFCVLLPCTFALGVVYRGVTFENWFTYVFILIFIAFGLASMEVGKRIKDKCKCCFSERSPAELDSQFRISK